MVFSRFFHHLNASLPHQLRSPHFSSFANFPAFSIIYTSPVLCLQVSLPSPSSPPPHLVPGAPFRFFILCTHFHSLSFSRACCHSRLLHPSLYLHCHKTAEIIIFSFFSLRKSRSFAAPPLFFPRRGN